MNMIEKKQTAMFDSERYSFNPFFQPEKCSPKQEVHRCVGSQTYDRLGVQLNIASS
jgi:hypothetical protein